MLLSDSFELLDSHRAQCQATALWRRSGSQCGVASRGLKRRRGEQFANLVLRVDVTPDEKWQAMLDNPIPTLLLVQRLFTCKNIKQKSEILFPHNKLCLQVLVSHLGGRG